MERNSEPTIAYPEWTEFREKNGLDPLGMQSSSVWLYQSLLPGISNVTLRIRYYGYYAWLSQSYAQSVGDTNPKTWQRYVRRAEALYALVAQHHGGETGVAGVTWARKALDGLNGNTVDFVDAAEPGSDNHYLKQAWGAYGAAYGSQLYEVGILADASDHEIPVPSSDLGEPLATAFDSALGPLATKVKKFIKNGRVPVRELDALASIGPSGIDPKGEERQCYERLLFATARPLRAADHERRRSLLLILRAISKLTTIPTDTQLRWMFYSGCTRAGASVDWGKQEFAHQRQRWWAYQANDMIHIVYEALLKFTLDILERYPAGVTLNELVGEAVAEIQSSVQGIPDNWGQFVDQSETKDWALEETLCAEVMGASRPESVCTGHGAFKALQLLALIQNRVRGAPEAAKTQFDTLHPMAFKSLATEMDFLNGHSKDPLASVVTKLIEERVIRRHLWIALRKLRYYGDYTFLIEADDGRVRLRVKDGPVFTNPRLRPALTFLSDIHLIGPGGLSSRGKRLLAGA